MESSIRFVRIRGIPVGAHWSWLFVFGLVVWSLSTSLFPATYPGLSGAAYVVIGAAAAVALFASVLLHELGHTFVALAHGVRIRGISLWLFGGVARFAGQIGGGRDRLSVVTTRDLRAILPFDVSFRDRPDIGGPSAGLAYALAIADMLDPPDDARGRAVAATGTIDAEGNVGDVGGVTEKAVAAEAAGADVFLVPRGEMSHADDAGGGLTVYGIDHLSQALQALRASG